MTFALMTRTMSVFLPLAAFRLLVLFLGLSTILVEDSDNHGGGTTVLSDLEEGVVVTEIFFALGAVVKVLADGTLVTNTFNGGSATAIALDIGVLDNRVLGLFAGVFILGNGDLHELVKDAGNGLLELSLNKALNGLSGHILCSITAALTFLTLLAFLSLAVGR